MLLGLQFQPENVRVIKRSKADLDSIKCILRVISLQSTAVMEKDVITYSPHEFEYERFLDCVFLKGLFLIRGHYQHRSFEDNSNEKKNTC